MPLHPLTRRITTPCLVGLVLAWSGASVSATPQPKPPPKRPATKRATPTPTPPRKKSRARAAARPRHHQVPRVATKPTPKPATRPAPKPSVWSRDSWRDPNKSPNLERGQNVYTARTTRPLSFLITIDHRARQPFTKDAWRDFLGLDAGGLKIGLGLRFGILKDLEVGIFRLNGTNEIFDTYELDARYRFLRQSKHHLDVAVRAGLTWFYQPRVDDAVGVFGQVMATRTLWGRLTLSLIVAFHSDSSGPEKSNLDTAWSLGVGGLVEVRIARFLAWNFELVGTVAGYGARWPAWSSSLKIVSPRHTFSFLLSNTQYIGADGLVAGSPLDLKHLIVGFIITRELNIHH